MAKPCTIPWLRRLWGALGMVLLPAIWLAGPIHANAAPPAASAPTVTVPLDYVENPIPVCQTVINIQQQSTPFKKEPAAAKGRVLRGVLQFGGSSNAIAFLWQRDAGKLILDLNRNQDLSDDPVISSGTLASPYQNFNKVPLRFATSSGLITVQADLQILSYSSFLECFVMSHSCWLGRASLAGQDWQVGIIPDVAKPADTWQSGSVLLRPWKQREKPFTTSDNLLSTFAFPEKVFVGGHAYRLECLPQGLTPAPNGLLKPILQFAEQTVPLGTVKLTGKHIQRLVLPHGAVLVICDQPTDTVQVPAGKYAQPEVLLEQNGVQAYCNTPVWQQEDNIFVTDKAPLNLAVGGPLTNTVKVTSHNQNLVLNYQLMGGGGQTYQLANEDRSHPPEFAIYKGARKIGSGSFEFG